MLCQPVTIRSCHAYLVHRQYYNTKLTTDCSSDWFYTSLDTACVKHDELTWFPSVPTNLFALLQWHRDFLMTCHQKRIHTYKQYGSIKYHGVYKLLFGDRAFQGKIPCARRSLTRFSVHCRKNMTNSQAHCTLHTYWVRDNEHRPFCRLTLIVWKYKIVKVKCLM